MVIFFSCSWIEENKRKCISCYLETVKVLTRITFYPSGYPVMEIFFYIHLFKWVSVEPVLYKPLWIICYYADSNVLEISALI